HAILTAEPSPLSTTERPVPSAISAIVTRLLKKSPEARFQSAGDLAWALEQASTTPVADGSQFGGPTRGPYNRLPASGDLDRGACDSRGHCARRRIVAPSTGRDEVASNAGAFHVATALRACARFGARCLTRQPEHRLHRPRWNREPARST